MREEQRGNMAQENKNAGLWPMDTELRSSAREEEIFRVRPLTPLSFDTVLTAGDIKRLLKIVSVI